MSEQVTIKGLLCVDEAGRYDLIGWNGGTFDDFRGVMKDVAWIGQRGEPGFASAVYEIVLDVPRPLIDRLSLRIAKVPYSPTPEVRDAKVQRVLPAVPPAVPVASPRVQGVRSTADPSPAAGEPAESENGVTILERIEQRLREAGGSLPFTHIECNRPVSIKPDVFRAAIAKRFVITKRGRGERVSLREGNS